MTLFEKEFLDLLPPTIFFFVAIGLLMFTKGLMLQQYGIPFSDLAAVIVGALIVGKVVLIVDHLPFVNKFPGKPLMYNVAWKTMIYAWRLSLFAFWKISFRSSSNMTVFERQWHASLAKWSGRISWSFTFGVRYFCSFIAR